MPKFNWKRKRAGVLGRKPHPYHRHWEFTYTEANRDEAICEAYLDNSDLEECAYKNQIKIVRGSVLLYIGEHHNSVRADLHLPVQVTMVVIHKFGKGVFCFANADGPKCYVYPGLELKKNPHSHRC